MKVLFLQLFSCDQTFNLGSGGIERINSILNTLQHFPKHGLPIHLFLIHVSAEVTWTMLELLTGAHGAVSNVGSALRTLTSPLLLTCYTYLSLIVDHHQMSQAQWPEQCEHLVYRSPRWDDVRTRVHVDWTILRSVLLLLKKFRSSAQSNCLISGRILLEIFW